MITLKESLHPIRWKIVLGIEPLRCVAVAADIRGDFEGRTAAQSHNLVFRMTIRASGGIAIAGGDGLAVHAFAYVLGDFVMAIAAGFGESRKMQWRFGRTGRQDGVSVVAITAGRRVLAPAG